MVSGSEAKTPKAQKAKAKVAIAVQIDFFIVPRILTHRLKKFGLYNMCNIENLKRIKDLMPKDFESFYRFRLALLEFIAIFVG